MNEQIIEKLSFRVKFGYGSAEGANSMIWTAFYIFFLFFLTDVVKMDPAFAGFIMMIGVMWDAITDPLVGIWSDSLKSKWGRRRPFLLGVAIPYGIISWLLFTDPNLSPVMTKAYFIAMVILYFTAFTCLNVPQTAMAAEMTQDYDERTSLVSYRALWSQVFSIIGGAVPLSLAAYLGGVFGDQGTGWSLMAAILGLVCIPLILITWRSTRGYEIFPEVTQVHIKDIYNAVFKNRPFRYTIGLWASTLVATNIAGAVMVYFMTYYMGFDENQASIAFLIFFGCTVFWIPFINITSSKIGKRWAFIIFMGIWALVQGVGVIFFIRPETVILMYVLLFLGSAGVVGIWLIGWSMIPDVVEVDEFKTGQRREGLYFGIIAFSQKTASAIALWVTGLLLSWVGYVPNVPQSEEALFGIRIMYAEGVTLFLILGIISAYLLPMTKEKHDALREAIALKKEGKECNTSSFEDIIR